MPKIYSFILILFLLMFTSCIPIKDLEYLQKTNKSNPEATIVPAVLKPYRIQINDVVSVRIKALDQKLVNMFNTSSIEGMQSNSSEALYFDGFTVNDHGEIRIPVLGEVAVIGLTLDEIRIKIEKQLLAEYFNKEADIFVSVKLAGLRYTVNGEITNPGSKILYQEKVNLLEAIANSGDITITGNRKEVLVVRQYPQGTEMHTIDLTSVEVLKSPYYYVQPNDFIYIKPLKQKSWGTGTNGLQSFTTILGAVSLLLTTFLLFKR
ncbi:polysaccharide biosynthesis/export family protein [Flavobacterium sp.]|uniref:polysaccharide biosynthesis/export family protein n=1 Tax=Flavobacterium sp. TaxID=239 RepID=UPI00286E9F10|nr:polysaccharide biosynthesis/export family protein [Flavobacterium sp.]